MASQLQVFIGSLGELQSPAQVYSPVVGAEIRLDAGASLSLPLQADWEHALIIAGGELHVDDPHQRRSPHALQAEARYN